jgi:uncharacterized phage protein gp47/JayE
MAFARPAFQDLYQQALTDIQSQSGTTSFLRRAVLPAVAWALAGLAWLHYGYLDYISLQSVPFTATDEYLYGWGALKGVTPKAASAASGTATFTGANGATISAGQIVVRGDNVNYTVTTGGTIVSNTVTVSIAALVAGAAGNANVGISLTLSSPASGVNAGGLAASALAGGADAELDPDYKTRMLAVYASPPQGGSQVDYMDWALAVPGVTRAWVAPNNAGAGTVTVYTMWDNAEASYAGFPQGTNGGATAETRISAATGDQLAVANAIFPVQPVTPVVYSLAPTAYPVNFTIADLDPPTNAIKAAISVALAGVFRRSAAPGGTLYPIALTNAPNGKMYPEQFYAAIGAVSGIRRFTLTSPSASITAGAGAIPSLGVVNYI